MYFYFENRFILHPKCVSAQTLDFGFSHIPTIKLSTPSHHRLPKASGGQKSRAASLGVRLSKPSETRVYLAIKKVFYSTFADLQSQLKSRPSKNCQMTPAY